jgi:predicted small lipoprotein YifL
MHFIGLKTGFCVLLITAMACLLSACGAKGDLYLPETQPPPPAQQAQQDKAKKASPDQPAADAPPQE